MSILRILVAEDNPTNQTVAQFLLARLGHKAEIANNGVEAVNAVTQHEFDIIFMDLQMPEMDGVEATRRIRAATCPERPWIIAMTANVQPADRAQCMDAGMQDFISKPATVQDMRAALERFEARERRSDTVEPAPHSLAWRVPSDLHEILDSCDGYAIVEELLGVFLSDAMVKIHSIREAARRGDFPDVARLAHSLRGSALQIGADPLAALVRSIEGQLKQGDSTAANAWADQLDAAFRAVQSAMRAFVQAR